MKSAMVFVPLLASLALAGPVKRAVVTVWETETVIVWKQVPSATPRPPSVQPAALYSVSSHSSIQSSSSVATIVPAKAQETSQPTKQAPVDGDSTDFASYAAVALEHHNLHRANHSAPPLIWDEDLASIAKEHAHSCVYAHSKLYGDGDYGQNIGGGYPPDKVANMVTTGMYNGEIGLYPGYGGEPDMTHFHSWGHFTQIVWKETQRVGCYTHKCAVLENTSSNMPPFFTVCNYRPSGNYEHQYARNVLAPLNEPSIIL